MEKKEEIGIIQNAEQNVIILPKAPKIFSLSLKGRYGRLNCINASVVLSLIYGAAIAVAAIVESSAIMVFASIVVSLYDARINTLRLHDMNKSGRLAIPIMVISILISCLPIYLGINALIISLYGVISIVTLMLFIIRGTKGENQYGEQPARGSWAGLIILVLGNAVGVGIFAYFASDMSNGTNFAVDMDKFPAFEYVEPAEQMGIWLWRDVAESEVDAAYIKKLQDAGFENVEGGYSKGNRVVLLDEDKVVFALVNAGIGIEDDIATVGFAMLMDFPKLKAKFMRTIYRTDFHLIYAESIEKSVLDSYIKTLEAAGFVYDQDAEYYQLADNEKQYIFNIDEFGMYHSYTWKVQNK